MRLPKTGFVFTDAALVKGTPLLFIRSMDITIKPQERLKVDALLRDRAPFREPEPAKVFQSEMPLS
jgi:hypothetical protein